MKFYVWQSQAAGRFPLVWKIVVLMLINGLNLWSGLYVGCYVGVLMIIRKLDAVFDNLGPY